VSTGIGTDPQGVFFSRAVGYTESSLKGGDCDVHSVHDPDLDLGSRCAGLCGAAVGHVEDAAQVLGLLDSVPSSAHFGAITEAMKTSEGDVPHVVTWNL
jgi:hypothetical protein